MNMVKNLIIKYKELIIYGVFGLCTTLVNFVTYKLFNMLLGVEYYLVSNIVAWFISVVFAYVTNKPFVFHSHDWSAQTVVPELGKFVGSRIASGGLETLFIFLTVDCLHWNGNIMKLLTSILVVILNYVASKLLVFRK